MIRDFHLGTSLVLVMMTLSISAPVFLGCDSQRRSDDQTVAADNQRPPETPGADYHPDIDPDESETAEQPPEPSALERYTRDIDEDGPLQMTINTSQGAIECRLFEDEAPITVANFVGLARGLKAYVDAENGDFVSGIPYYENVVFHRVIPNFLIQSGDRGGNGHGGPGYSIPDEFSDTLRHDRPGILSMANRGPNTGGSQFFITEKPAPHLDDRHTIFGECESKNVIRAISHVPTAGMNRPVDPAPRIHSILFSREKIAN